MVHGFTRIERIRKIMIILFERENFAIIKSDFDIAQNSGNYNYQRD